MRWFKKPKVWQEAKDAMSWCDVLQARRAQEVAARAATLAAYRKPKVEGIHWDGEKYVGANDNKP